MANYVGKDVSIKLKRDLGIFQGKIVKPEANSITISNVFHNGVKFKKFDSQITISKDEIETINFIQIVDPEVASKSIRSTPITQNEGTSPKQTEVLTKAVVTKSPPNFTNKKPNQYDGNMKQHKTTRPIPIKRNTPNGNHAKSSDTQQGKRNNFNNNNNNNNNIKNMKRNRNFDLMQHEDFSDQGDFDFETNNAMFDKKTIFQEIEASIFGKNPEKPDLVRQIGKAEEKYRHDENVLDSMLMQFKNIQLEFKPKQEYATDEGVIIPSIPQSLRNRIQNLAASHGYSMERQNDLLARGATELALQLLGGSRRLSPKNLHQWPRVVVICDEPYNNKQSEVGLCTARQLASHGVTVMVFVKTSTSNAKESKELELYTATGNDFTANVKDLQPCDLIILSCVNMNQNSQIVRYIQENRTMVMAIDPPVMGINPGEINIRNTVVPILPLEDIHNSCGKLHLVNLCISNKFFKDAGIKYFPVFGGRSIIPLHLKTA